MANIGDTFKPGEKDGTGRNGSGPVEDDHTVVDRMCHGHEFGA
jgi:hypothetical protein